MRCVFGVLSSASTWPNRLSRGDACGTDRGRIERVLNGIHPARLPEVTGEPEVPTLSWIGRPDPLKDLETLLRAFALVHEVIPESHLRLFGPTPEGNEAYHERFVRLSEQRR